MLLSLLSVRSAPQHKWEYGISRQIHKQGGLGKLHTLEEEKRSSGSGVDNLS